MMHLACLNASKNHAAVLPIVTFAVALHSIHLVTRDTSARSIEDRVKSGIPRRLTGREESIKRLNLPVIVVIVPGLGTTRN